MKHISRLLLTSLLMSFPALLFGDTVWFQEGSGGYAHQEDLCINASGGIWSGDARIAMDASPRYQSLIKFEEIFGGASHQVPLGAEIEYAAIKLKTGNRISTYSGTVNDIDIYQVNASWSEASRWNDFSVINDSVGAKAVSALIGTYTNTIANDEVTVFDVTTAVKSWHAGSAPNYGILFVNEGGDGCDFWSDASPFVYERPILEVRYFIRPALNISVSGIGVGLTFRTELGCQYQAQWSSDLVSTNWLDLGGSVVGDGDIVSILDTATGSATSRFYRAIIRRGQ